MDDVLDTCGLAVEDGVASSTNGSSCPIGHVHTACFVSKYGLYLGIGLHGYLSSFPISALTLYIYFLQYQSLSNTLLVIIQLLTTVTIKQKDNAFGTSFCYNFLPRYYIGIILQCPALHVCDVQCEPDTPSMLFV